MIAPPQHPTGPGLPVQQVVDRVFHFSILLPFMRLDERAGRNVAVDAEFNDVTLMAADLCVACYHFVEQVQVDNARLAKALRAFGEWQQLRDIAHTRKHFIRNNPKKQIRLSAMLVFELNKLGWFGFLETQVIAETVGGVAYDVLALVYKFIEAYRAAAFDSALPPMTPAARRATAFYPEARIRFSAETHTLAATTFKLVRRDPDDTLVAAAGVEVPLKMELDLPAEQNAGRWKLQYSFAEAEAWVAEVNGENLAGIAGSPGFHKRS